MATINLEMNLCIDTDYVEREAKVSPKIFEHNCHLLEEELSSILDEDFFINMIRENDAWIDFASTEADCYEINEEAIKLIKTFIVDNYEDADDLDFAFRIFIEAYSSSCYILIMSKEYMRKKGWH